MDITVEKNLLNNQSILQNFALGEEIDEQAAEIISGGNERFTIINATQKAISYTVDDVVFVLEPGKEIRYTTPLGGKLRFDRDIRDERARLREYDLKDGKTYVFRPDKSNNANYIELYQGQ
jgi:hypothetical protein